MSSITGGGYNTPGFLDPSIACDFNSIEFQSQHRALRTDCTLGICIPRDTSSYDSRL